MKLFLYCFRDFDEKPYYDQLSAAHGFAYGATPAYPSLQNAKLAEGYEAISTTVTAFGPELLAALKEAGVQSLITRSIGVDHIDLPAARALGLHVAHVAYPPESVADYAVMLCMMGLRRMKQILDRSAIQDYSLRGKIGRDLCECTVGIVGTGRIGKTVARRLSAFGCRILAYDPYPDAGLSGICEYVSFAELLENSDVVTLHIPATPDTFHLLDADAFARMKPGALLVNTARGTLVDTEALIAALEAGRLSGACLDVIEDEQGLYYINRMGDCLPNPQLARLRALPNVLLTSHTAFYTERVVRSMAEQVVQIAEDIEAGRANPLVLF